MKCHQLDHIQIIWTSPQTDNIDIQIFYRLGALPDAKNQRQSIEGNYYMLTFTGLMCLSASSSNCVLWCANARTALLHSIWRYTGHQSVRPHHDSIFVRLPAINWQCCHISGPHMVVGRLLSLVCRRGTHCQNVSVIPLLVLLLLAVFSKHFLFSKY